MSARASDDERRSLLANAATLAVVGLSSDVTRPSYGVASYMQRMGYRVIPVNPHEQQVLGEPAYPNLRALPDGLRIDIVNVFRRPSAVPEIVDDAIAIGAPALWLQLGVAHEGAEKTARQAGLIVIADECIEIEHARLIGARKNGVG
jgi:uncharacterized protein